MARPLLPCSPLAWSILAWSILVWPRGAAASPPVDLTVDITGLSGTEGHLLVSVFDSSGTWLKTAAHAERLPLSGPNMTVMFRGLPVGEYAVGVIHDRNDNRELDMAWLPLPHPAEPTGASNDPRPLLGPPSWSDARFSLTTTHQLTIVMQD